jgi:hypothetical protein
MLWLCCIFGDALSPKRAETGALFCLIVDHCNYSHPIAFEITLKRFEHKNN